ncbi:hypothetical protein [Paracoccus aminophilus]|uniref:hypothetical protein n=1 Tax=Paracoccus aminophilus TaxID=34003 RepID=UPI00041F3D98|nr:hypothetical protein [Paracoccus aminophilus]
MGRRANFTEAQIKRAIRAAREIDNRAIVEVTAEGTIRILPEALQKNRSDVDEWFGQDD